MGWPEEEGVSAMTLSTKLRMQNAHHHITKDNSDFSCSHRDYLAVEGIRDNVKKKKSSKRYPEGAARVAGAATATWATGVAANLSAGVVCNLHDSMINAMYQACNY